MNNSKNRGAGRGQHAARIEQAYELMTKGGLTQKETAKRIGVSEQTVSKWLRSEPGLNDRITKHFMSCAAAGLANIAGAVGRAVNVVSKRQHRAFIEMAFLLMTEGGLTQKETAKKMGVSVQAMCRWMRYEPGLSDRIKAYNVKKYPGYRKYENDLRRFIDWIGDNEPEKLELVMGLKKAFKDDLNGNKKH